MDKQKDILSAALKLFVTYGFHGTPTSKIAKEAGVANGTLFHYYKTKEDLIVALYVDIKTRMACYVQADEVANETIREKCKHYYTAALTWGIDHDTEFSYAQQFASSPYVSLIPPELQEQSQLVLNMVKAGIKTKEIKPLQPDLINSLLMSHVFGTNQYIINARLSPAEQKKTINTSFELIWDMIAR